MSNGDNPCRTGWVLSVLKEYEVRLTRYVIRLTGDEHLASDVVQHAFMRLCEQDPEKVREHVAAWLYAVCRNRVVEICRKERRMELFGEVRQAGCQSAEPNPATTAESNDTFALLKRIIRMLPAVQRDVIELWSEGFTYRQISQITQRTEGNVRVLMHRAIKKIRQHPLVLKVIFEQTGTAAG